MLGLGPNGSEPQGPSAIARKSGPLATLIIGTASVAAWRNLDGLSTSLPTALAEEVAQNCTRVELRYPGKSKTPETDYPRSSKPQRTLRGGQLHRRALAHHRHEARGAGQGALSGIGTCRNQVPGQVYNCRQAGRTRTERGARAARVSRDCRYES